MDDVADAFRASHVTGVVLLQSISDDDLIKMKIDDEMQRRAVLGAIKKLLSTRRQSLFFKR